MSQKLKLYKERREFFMDPNFALAEGVVAVSEEVTPDLLFEAYSFGIFPWPHNEKDPVLWFCPEKRAVLEFDRLHIASSLAKAQRRAGWQFTMDRAFATVVERCASAKRPDQAGTWIIERMKRAYLQLFRQGYAHSVECWNGDQLIGGLYGVYVGGVFSAESMFYEKPNASKLCLLHLIGYLQKRGMSWLDIQMLTPHMKRMGAHEVSRSQFLKMLEAAKREARPWL